jgi:hypothetical protein
MRGQSDLSCGYPAAVHSDNFGQGAYGNNARFGKPRRCGSAFLPPEAASTILSDHLRHRTLRVQGHAYRPQPEENGRDVRRGGVLSNEGW